MKDSTPELTRTGSHSVTLDSGMRGFKEEVFLYFATDWRGQPATVTMEANRYTHSSGLSEWRIFAREARGADTTGAGWTGDSLTETARRRLSDRCRPAVEAWLASEDYTASCQRAHYDAIRHELYEARPFRDRPTQRAREQILRYVDQLRPADAERLVAMADAYDRFSELYNVEA